MSLIFSQVTLCMLILAVGFSTQAPRTFDEFDEKKDKLSNKEIGERLEVLTNEVMLLKKEVREIKRPKIKELEAKTDEAEYDELQKILSVSRKSLSDEKVQYTIRYQENSTFRNEAIWRRLEDYTYTLMPETISNEISRLPRSVYETSVITKVANDTNIFVTIGHAKKWLALYLDNTVNNDLKETDINTPILDISPRGDIVYQPGQNATVTVAHPLRNEREDPGPRYYMNDNFRLLYNLVTPEGEELFDNFGSDFNLFHLFSETKFLDKSEVKATIATANSSYSGVLELYSGKNMKSGLVKRIENHKQVILRPSTQKHPFPDGKIYIRKFYVENGKENDNGDTVSLCFYGKTCPRYCSFLGNNLLDLKLYKSVDGETSSEFLDVYNKEPLSFERSGMFQVSPVEGDPFPVTYTCMASNNLGQILSFNNVVYFGHEIKILRNETMMKRLENGSSVELVCTAKGSPFPKMSIQCDASETIPDVLYQTDDVISVTATCEYVNEWSYLGCTASNDFQSDSYVFDTYGYSSLINY